MGVTRDVSAAARVCFVASTNPEKATVRVRIPDLDNLISHDLQVVQRKARKDKNYWLPDLDEEVFCLFLGNGLECGFVLGALYNTEDKPPANSQDKQHTAFEDGTWFEYDRKEHRARAHVEGCLDIFATGDINIKSGGRVFVNGAEVRINDPSAPTNAALELEYIDG